MQMNKDFHLKKFGDRRINFLIVIILKDLYLLDMDMRSKSY